MNKNKTIIKDYQTLFLNNCRRDKVTVLVHCNDYSRGGLIVGYDLFTIVLEVSEGTNTQQELIYKSNIISISLENNTLSKYPIDINKSI